MFFMIETRQYVLIRWLKIWIQLSLYIYIILCLFSFYVYKVDIIEHGIIFIPFILAVFPSSIASSVIFPIFLFFGCIQKRKTISESDRMSMKKWKIVVPLFSLSVISFTIITVWLHFNIKFY